MHICRFQTSHSLALPWMDSALKAELTFYFSLALYSSHRHCPLTMPRNAAEVWWSDRVVGPSQTQPSSQRAPAPVSLHSTAPRYRSYWLLMVSSAVAAWETLAEETFSFLEGLERRCWIYSQS